VGDFVQIQTPVGVDVGVVLPATIKSGLNSIKANVTEFDMVTVNGEVRSVFANAVLFYIPEFVEPKLAEQAAKILIEGPISKDETLQQDGQTKEVLLQEEKELFSRNRFNARAKICMKLRALLQQTEHRKQGMFPFFERIYLSGKYNKSLSTEADGVSYFRTASQVSAELLKASDMADNLISRFSSEPPSIFAAHQLITSAPQIFRMDNMSHMSMQRFRLLPMAEQDVEATVKRLVTTSLEYINSAATSIKDVDPIEAFAKRVQEVKDLRREAAERLPKDLATAGPSATPFDRPANSMWEEDDRCILRFLRNSLGEPRKIISERQVELALYILKRCGYAAELAPSPDDDTPVPSLETLTEEKKLMMAFFRDLGYLAPWDDQATLMNEFMSNIEPANVDAGQLKLKDDGHLRRDHHEKVYVIDDEAAAELDDGISIERTTDAQMSWVHVHIADPTAAMDMDDAVARDAEKRFSSVYLVQGKWAMLPDAITNKLGLRPNEANKDQALRAMTFSAKVHHQTGTVSEIGMSLSRLHTVKVMSYKEAHGVMEREAERQEDLPLLYTIAKALSKRRTQFYGAVQYQSDWRSSAVKLNNTSLPPSPLRQTTFAPDSLQPVLFTGKPDATFVQSGKMEGEQSSSASQLTVSEMALLAGRTAAKFAQHHRIPALFRYQPSPASAAESERFLSLRDKDGTISESAFKRSDVALSSATVAAEPCEHFLMGVRTRLAMRAPTSSSDDLLSDAGYVRVTSPLRRYADLMMHWQFRSFLEQTHESSTNVANGDTTFAPRQIDHVFSQSQLHRQLALVSRMERWHKSLERANLRAWKIYCLFDAFSATKRSEQIPSLVSTTYEAVVDRSGIRVQKDGRPRLSVIIGGLDLPAISLLPKSFDHRRSLPLLNADPVCQMGRTSRVRIIDVQEIAGNTAVLVEPV
jgi:hypothetical protein